jgi:hypothetical protein
MNIYLKSKYKLYSLLNLFNEVNKGSIHFVFIFLERNNFILYPIFRMKVSILENKVKLDPNSFKEFILEFERFNLNSVVT